MTDPKKICIEFTLTNSSKLYQTYLLGGVCAVVFNKLYYRQCIFQQEVRT